MGLPTLQDRREREDVIILYKILNGIEKLDKHDLMMKEIGQMRRHFKEELVFTGH